MDAAEVVVNEVESEGVEMVVAWGSRLRFPLGREPQAHTHFYYTTHGGRGLLCLVRTIVATWIRS